RGGRRAAAARTRASTATRSGAGRTKTTRGGEDQLHSPAILAGAKCSTPARMAGLFRGLLFVAIGECQQGVARHQIWVRLHPALVLVDPAAVGLLALGQRVHQLLPPVVLLAF